MTEWLRFWEWMTGNGVEPGEVAEADVQTQLNDLNLGNVSTGDICNYFEGAYRNAGGHEGGFSYPPAGASPAQAATYYGQHVTVDSSQAWHFHADDGAVINLGNIGGDVVTNPDLDVDLGFGKGKVTDDPYENPPEDGDQTPEDPYDDPPEDGDQTPEDPYDDPPEDGDQTPEDPYDDPPEDGDQTTDDPYDDPPEGQGFGIGTTQYEGPIDLGLPHGPGGPPPEDQGEGQQYEEPIKYVEYGEPEYVEYGGSVPELSPDLRHDGGTIDPIP
jgi:hypothetical protein